MSKMKVFVTLLLLSRDVLLQAGPFQVVEAGKSSRTSEHNKPMEVGDLQRWVVAQQISPLYAFASFDTPDAYLYSGVFWDGQRLFQNLKDMSEQFDDRTKFMNKKKEHTEWIQAMAAKFITLERILNIHLYNANIGPTVQPINVEENIYSRDEQTHVDLGYFYAANIYATKIKSQLKLSSAAPSDLYNKVKHSMEQITISTQSMILSFTQLSYFQSRHIQYLLETCVDFSRYCDETPQCKKSISETDVALSTINHKIFEVQDKLKTFNDDYRSESKSTFLETVTGKVFHPKNPLSEKTKIKMSRGNSTFFEKVTKTSTTRRFSEKVVGSSSSEEHQAVTIAVKLSKVRTNLAPSEKVLTDWAVSLADGMLYSVKLQTDYLKVFLQYSFNQFSSPGKSKLDQDSWETTLKENPVIIDFIKIRTIIKSLLTEYNELNTIYKLLIVGSPPILEGLSKIFRAFSQGVKKQVVHIKDVPQAPGIENFKDRDLFLVMDDVRSSLTYKDKSSISRNLTPVEMIIRKEEFESPRGGRQTVPEEYRPRVASSFTQVKGDLPEEQTEFATLGGFSSYTDSVWSSFNLPEPVPHTNLPLLAFTQVGRASDSSVSNDLGNPFSVWKNQLGQAQSPARTYTQGIAATSPKFRQTFTQKESSAMADVEKDQDLDTNVLNFYSKAPDVVQTRQKAIVFLLNLMNNVIRGVKIYVYVNNELYVEQCKGNVEIEKLQKEVEDFQQNKETKFALRNIKSGAESGNWVDFLGNYAEQISAINADIGLASTLAGSVRGLCRIKQQDKTMLEVISNPKVLQNRSNSGSTEKLNRSDSDLLKKAYEKYKRIRRAELLELSIHSATKFSNELAFRSVFDRCSLEFQQVAEAYVRAREIDRFPILTYCVEGISSESMYLEKCKPIWDEINAEGRDVPHAMSYTSQFGQLSEAIEKIQSREKQIDSCYDADYIPNLLRTGLYQLKCESKQKCQLADEEPTNPLDRGNYSAHLTRVSHEVWFVCQKQKEFDDIMQKNDVDRKAKLGVFAIELEKHVNNIEKDGETSTRMKEILAQMTALQWHASLPLLERIFEKIGDELKKVENPDADIQIDLTGLRQLCTVSSGESPEPPSPQCTKSMEVIGTGLREYVESTRKESDEETLNRQNTHLHRVLKSYAMLHSSFTYLAQHFFEMFKLKTPEEVGGIDEKLKDFKKIMKNLNHRYKDGVTILRKLVLKNMIDILKKKVSEAEPEGKLIDITKFSVQWVVSLDTLGREHGDDLWQYKRIEDLLQLYRNNPVDDLRKEVNEKWVSIQNEIRTSVENNIQAEILSEDKIKAAREGLSKDEGWLVGKEGLLMKYLGDNKNSNTFRELYLTLTTIRLYITMRKAELLLQYAEVTCQPDSKDDEQKTVILVQQSILKLQTANLYDQTNTSSTQVDDADVVDADAAGGDLMSEMKQQGAKLSVLILGKRELITSYVGHHKYYKSESSFETAAKDLDTFYKSFDLSIQEIEKARDERMGALMLLNSSGISNYSAMVSTTSNRAAASLTGVEYNYNMNPNVDDDYDHENDEDLFSIANNAVEYHGKEDAKTKAANRLLEVLRFRLIPIGKIKHRIKQIEKALTDDTLQGRDANGIARIFKPTEENPGFVRTSTTEAGPDGVIHNQIKQVRTMLIPKEGMDRTATNALEAKKKKIVDHLNYLERFNNFLFAVQKISVMKNLPSHGFEFAEDSIVSPAEIDEGLRDKINLTLNAFRESATIRELCLKDKLGKDDEAMKLVSAASHVRLLRYRYGVTVYGFDEKVKSCIELVPDKMTLREEFEKECGKPQGATPAQQAEDHPVNELALLQMKLDFTGDPQKSATKCSSLSNTVNHFFKFRDATIFLERYFLDNHSKNALSDDQLSKMFENAKRNKITLLDKNDELGGTFVNINRRLEVLQGVHEVSQKLRKMHTTGSSKASDTPGEDPVQALEQLANDSPLKDNLIDPWIELMMFVKKMKGFAKSNGESENTFNGEGTVYNAIASSPLLLSRSGTPQIVKDYWRETRTLQTITASGISSMDKVEDATNVLVSTIDKVRSDPSLPGSLDTTDGPLIKNMLERGYFKAKDVVKSVDKFIQETLDATSLKDDTEDPSDASSETKLDDCIEKIRKIAGPEAADSSSGGSSHQDQLKRLARATEDSPQLQFEIQRLLIVESIRAFQRKIEGSLKTNVNGISTVVKEQAQKWPEAKKTWKAALSEANGISGNQILSQEMSDEQASKPQDSNTVDVGGGGESDSEKVNSTLHFHMTDFEVTQSHRNINGETTGEDHSTSDGGNFTGLNVVLIRKDPRIRKLIKQTDEEVAFMTDVIEDTLTEVGGLVGIITSTETSPQDTGEPLYARVEFLNQWRDKAEERQAQIHRRANDCLTRKEDFRKVVDGDYSGNSFSSMGGGSRSSSLLLSRGSQPLTTPTKTMQDSLYLYGKVVLAFYEVFFAGDLRLQLLLLETVPLGGGSVVDVDGGSYWVSYSSRQLGTLQRSLKSKKERVDTLLDNLAIQIHVPAGAEGVNRLDALQAALRKEKKDREASVGETEEDAAKTNAEPRAGTASSEPFGPNRGPRALIESVNPAITPRSAIAILLPGCADAVSETAADSATNSNAKSSNDGKVASKADKKVENKGSCPVGASYNQEDYLKAAIKSFHDKRAAYEKEHAQVEGYSEIYDRLLPVVAEAHQVWEPKCYYCAQSFIEKHAFMENSFMHKYPSFMEKPVRDYQNPMKDYRKSTKDPSSKSLHGFLLEKSLSTSPLENTSPFAMASTGLESRSESEGSESRDPSTKKSFIEVGSDDSVKARLSNLLREFDNTHRHSSYILKPLESTSKLSLRAWVDKQKQVDLSNTKTNSENNSQRESKGAFAVQEGITRINNSYKLALCVLDVALILSDAADPPEQEVDESSSGMADNKTVEAFQYARNFVHKNDKNTKKFPNAAARIQECKNTKVQHLGSSFLQQSSPFLQSSIAARYSIDFGSSTKLSAKSSATDPVSYHLPSSESLTPTPSKNHIEISPSESCLTSQGSETFPESYLQLSKRLSTGSPPNDIKSSTEDDITSIPERLRARSPDSVFVQVESEWKMILNILELWDERTSRLITQTEEQLRKQREQLEDSNGNSDVDQTNSAADERDNPKPADAEKPCSRITEGVLPIAALAGTAYYLHQKSEDENAASADRAQQLVEKQQSDFKVKMDEQQEKQVDVDDKLSDIRRALADLQKNVTGEDSKSGDDTREGNGNLRGRTPGVVHRSSRSALANEMKSDGLGAGGIIGIDIAVLVVCVIGIIVVLRCLPKSKSTDEENEEWERLGQSDFDDLRSYRGERVGYNQSTGQSRGDKQPEGNNLSRLMDSDIQSIELLYSYDQEMSGQKFEQSNTSGTSAMNVLQSEQIQEHLDKEGDPDGLRDDDFAKWVQGDKK